MPSDTLLLPNDSTGWDTAAVSKSLFPSLSPLQTVEGFWRRPPSEWKGNASHLRVLHPYVTYEATYKLLQLEESNKVRP